MTINNEQLRREVDILKTDNTQLRTDNDAKKDENKQLTTLLDNQIQQINSQSSENAQLRTEVQQLKVSQWLRITCICLTILI